MFTSYFDEAGGEDHGFIVVCGYAGTFESWQQFEWDWKIFLANYRVPYFHMKEYSQSKGAFEAWEGKDGTRTTFLRDASRIIDEASHHAFICHVDYTIFAEIDRYIELSEAFGSPYGLAARTCADMAVTWNRRQSGKVEMECVFESGGPGVGDLMKAMDIPPRLPRPIFKPSIDTEAERGVVQLQPADFLAYEIRKYVVDHPKIKKREMCERKSLRSLTPVKLATTFYTPNKMLERCQALGVKKRRVPKPAA
jgi:hypothetical protein